MTNVSQIVAEVPPAGPGTFHAGRFIGASAAISAIRLCGRGALFAAALIASRHLSPSSFGIYVYVLTFFTAVNLVGALGLEQSALIALGRGRAAGDSVFLHRVLSKIVRRALLTLPVASLVFAVPVSWVLPSLTAMCCFVLSGCCLTAIVVAAGVLRGLDYPVASSIVQESGRGLVIFLGVITLYFGWQLQGVWISTLIFAALFACFGIAAATSAARKLLANLANNAPAARHSSQHDVHLPAQFRFLLVLIATNAFLWLCPVILNVMRPQSPKSRFSTWRCSIRRCFRSYRLRSR